MYNYKQSNALQIANNLLSNVRGGMSLNWSGQQPTAGFMVAIDGQGLEFDSISETNAHEIASWICEQHEKGLGKYFGIWHDNSVSEKVFVDLSVNISDKNEALCAGVMQNQLAIYDIMNGKEIRT